MPWRGKQPLEITMNVAGKRQAPAIPPEADGFLAALLRGCFSHAQEGRPSAMETLTALRGGEAGRRVSAERGKAAVGVSRPASPQRPTQAEIAAAAEAATVAHVA